ncbi:MAG: hypothetical protein CMF96_06475 [Candidatus Marinimicrobia bacterium]|nr:hypothetical protein [Candidatus Neomarinimicrobiota bacterium]
MKISKYSPIKILGGGISGLTAAIFLKNAGYDPIIYEKNTQCGSGRHGDIEGLETWNFNLNPIQFLKFLNIPLNFNYKSENQFKIHFDNYPSLDVYDENPFFYLVKRGRDSGDLDKELQSYALSIGCEIRFNFSPKIENMSIIATGSNSAKAYIQGYTFKTDLPNQTHLFLNESLTKSGYGYLIIWDGNATLSVAYKKKDNKGRQILNKLIQVSQNKLDINIPKDNQKYGSYGSFDIDTPKIDQFGKLYVGEAGGFQDYLFGFGMNYAIYSSYYAVKSLVDKIDFMKSINQNIFPHMKASLVNRYFYEKLSEKNKYQICKILSKSDNPLKILRKRSNYSIKKQLMFKLFNKKLKSI